MYTGTDAIKFKAPGEADAELGRLASEGLIDIVQTTDSDVFLFGAPTVIKM
jgi:5'-3' exonuclease